MYGKNLQLKKILPQNWQNMLKKKIAPEILSTALESGKVSA